MRGVALSDLHLGHRRFAATEAGRNAREVDIERAWFRAVDNTVEAEPHLVTIAGDCFEHPRVGTAAEIAFRDGIRQIVDETDAHVVILQGNHCAVKTAGSQSPVRIPEDYHRVHVVTSPRRIRFDTPLGVDVAVACFPYTALDEDATYSLEPDPEADVNVLALHGAVKGDDEADALPWFYVSGKALDVGREADRWDVVACGDYHDHTRLHPNELAFYSGAIERTSSNIWDEDPEKGVVVFDTETGEMELVTHEIRGLHDVSVDFDPEQGVEAVNDSLEAFTEEGFKGKIVRFKVRGFPRGDRQNVDWGRVRAAKANCLHFQLDLEWAERGGAGFRDRREGPTRTLTSDARQFFEDDEPDVRRCAFSYLDIEEGGDDDTDRTSSVRADAAESPQGAPSDNLQPAGGAA